MGEIQLRKWTDENYKLAKQKVCECRRPYQMNIADDTCTLCGYRISFKEREEKRRKTLDKNVVWFNPNDQDNWVFNLH